MKYARTERVAVRARGRRTGVSVDLDILHEENDMSKVTMACDAEVNRIAKEHLGVPTLATRNSDSLDFHDGISVWSIHNALAAAYAAGALGAIARATPTKSQGAGEIAPDPNKCPGCGYAWTAEHIAYFEAKQSQDPPYVCADCRANEQEAWSREAQT